MGIEDSRKKIKENVESLNKQKKDIADQILKDLLKTTDEEEINDALDLYDGDIQKAIDTIALQKGIIIDKKDLTNNDIEALKKDVKALIIESLKEQYEFIIENEKEVELLDKDKETLKNLNIESNSKLEPLEAELKKLEDEKSAEIEKLDNKVQESIDYVTKYEEKHKGVIDAFENASRLKELNDELGDFSEIEELEEDIVEIQTKLSKFIDEDGTLQDIDLDLLNPEDKDYYLELTKDIWSNFYYQNKKTLEELGIDFVKYDDFVKNINNIDTYTKNIAEKITAKQEELENAANPSEEDETKKSKLQALSDINNNFKTNIDTLKGQLAKTQKDVIEFYDKELITKAGELEQAIDKKNIYGTDINDKIKNCNKKIENLEEEQAICQKKDNFSAKMRQAMYIDGYNNYLDHKDKIMTADEIIDFVDDDFNFHDTDADGIELSSKNEQIKSLKDKINKIKKEQEKNGKRINEIDTLKQEHENQKQQLVDDIEKYNGYEELGITIGANDILDKSSKEKNTPAKSTGTQKENQSVEDQQPNSNNPRTVEVQEQQDPNDDYLPILSKKDAKTRAKEIYYKFQNLNEEGQKNYLNGPGFNEMLIAVPALSKRKKNKLKILTLANIDDLNPGTVKDIGQVLTNVNTSFQDPPLDGFKIDDLFDVNNGKLKPFKDQDKHTIDVVNTLLKDIKANKAIINPEHLDFINKNLIPSLKEGLVVKELETTKPGIFDRAKAKQRDKSLSSLIGTLQSYDKPEQTQERPTDTIEKPYTVVSSNESKTQSIIDALQASVEPTSEGYNSQPHKSQSAPSKDAR